MGSEPVKLSQYHQKYVDLPQGNKAPSKVEPNQMLVPRPPLEFDRYRQQERTPWSDQAS